MTNPSSKEVEPAFEPCWCRKDTEYLRVKAHMDHGEFGCCERGRYVYCPNCWACGPTYNTDKEAIEGWNKSRRVSADSAGAMVDHRRIATEIGRYIVLGGLSDAAISDVAAELERLLAAPQSNLQPHAYQVHPHYPNYCAFAVGDEDYCKREPDNAIHQVVASPAVPRDEAVRAGGNSADLAQSVRIGIYNWTLGLADDRLAVITNKDVQALADMVIAAITDNHD